MAHRKNNWLAKDWVLSGGKKQAAVGSIASQETKVANPFQSQESTAKIFFTTTMDKVNLEVSWLAHLTSSHTLLKEAVETSGKQIPATINLNFPESSAKHRTALTAITDSLVQNSKITDS